MVLNYDCVRDILIVLETGLVMDTTKRMIPMNASNIIDRYGAEMPYTLQEIEYTLMKLKEGEYIEATVSKKPILCESGNVSYEHSIVVNDITYKGHEYLNSIRDSNVWESVRKLGKSVALSTIPAIAEKIVLKMIT